MILCITMVSRDCYITHFIQKMFSSDIQSPWFYIAKVNSKTTCSAYLLVAQIQKTRLTSLQANRVPKCDVTKIVFLEYIHFGLKI